MEEVIVMQMQSEERVHMESKSWKMGLSVFMAYSEISCFLKRGL